jgi:predicted phosphodiesterase
MGNEALDAGLKVDEEDIRYPQVGIMADSHGKADKIAAALEFFTNRNCRCLFHLGDICDSTHPESANACVRLLQESAVKSVKGNNDHLIVVNHHNQRQTPVSKETLDFLQNLPLVRKYQYVVLAHSLPFVGELGLSSMIGVMDAIQADRFFRSFPQSILIRGHSHTPELIHQQGDRIVFQPLAVNHKINLVDRLPCVVTCGGLTEGLGLIWRPAEKAIECSSFE